MRAPLAPSGLQPLMTVAKEPGHRGARRKPLKPLRAGMPGDSSVLVVTRVRSINTKCTRDRGCNGHPAFPTPSLGGRAKQRLGRIASRGRKRVFRRHCERSEAIPGAEGNASQHSTDRAQKRATVSQGLERIRQVARQRTEEKFTTLLHHISTDHLEQAFLELKEDAAPGVDGLRWRDYEADLEHNLEGLHARVHRGAYRALPGRRVYIPKPNGRQRPLAVAALEDKIVQRATTALLNAIYEEDFLGFS